MQFFFVLVTGLFPERIGVKAFITALVEGAKNSVLIIVVCVIGLVVGTFTLTGLALSISSSIINIRW